MQSRLIIYTPLFLLFLFSCSSETPDNSRFENFKEDYSKRDKNGPFLEFEQNESNKIVKRYNSVAYHFKLINSLDFLYQSGKKVDNNDKEELDKETVLILEFENLVDGQLSVYDNKSIKFNKDDAIKYLSGNILSDIEIIQNDSTFYANGVNFEGNVGNTGSIRALLFFKGIDTKQKSKIHYYDRLFGAGLINITISGKNQIVL